jgi:hypothetical protein
MQKVFAQKIPEHEGNSGVTKLANGGGDPNAPTTSVWNCCMIPNDGRLNNDYVAALPQMNVPVPRNMYYCLSWLQEMYVPFIVCQGYITILITIPQVQNYSWSSKYQQFFSV